MAKPSAKKKKKAKPRPPAEPEGAPYIGGLCRVSGLGARGSRAGGGIGGADERDDDLLGCLAELDDAAVAAAGEDDEGDGGVGADDASPVPAASSSPSRDDRPYRSARPVRRQTPPPPPPDLDPSSLPSVRVELLRHRLVGELSSYLLQEFRRVRMPVFERWSIDSKIEERRKRREREEARKCGAAAGGGAGKKRKRRGGGPSPALPPWDPVVPSAAEMEDGATRRLMEEIIEAEGGSPNAGNGDEEEEELEKKAERICRGLCRRAADAAHQIHSLAKRLGGKGSSSASNYGSRHGKKKQKASGERITLEKRRRGDDRADNDDGDTDGADLYSLVYERKQKKKFVDGDGGGGVKTFVVKINASHYQKLRSVFDLVHPPPTTGPSSAAPPTMIHAFHHLLFVLLVRYSSLAGGQLLRDLRGGGMQGAVHESAFDFLQRWCSSSGRGRLAGECFASPLNAYLGAGRFRSAFSRDLDCHFGSGGDFFDWDCAGNEEGAGDGAWYECNPPFSPGLMSEMVRRIRGHLDLAEEEGRALTFVVIVPTCRGDAAAAAGHVDEEEPAARRFATPSFASMLDSPRLSLHVVLPSGRHGYVEGAQHLRPTRYKTSSCDTSVIVLQSPAASERERRIEQDEEGSREGRSWRARLEEGLRGAFASRHQGELWGRRGEEDRSEEQDNEGHELTDVAESSHAKTAGENVAGESQLAASPSSREKGSDEPKGEAKKEARKAKKGKRKKDLAGGKLAKKTKKRG